MKTMRAIGQVYPVAETAANLSSQVVALPVAGVAGLGAMAGKALGLTDADPAEVVHDVSGALTYKPQTELGQHLTGAAMYPFEKLAEVGRAAGDRTLEITGSPAAATAVDTAINAAPMLIGVKARPKGPLEKAAEHVQPESVAQPVTAHQEPVVIESHHEIPPAAAPERPATIAQEATTRSLEAPGIGKPQELRADRPDSFPDDLAHETKPNANPGMDSSLSVGMDAADRKVATRVGEHPELPITEAMPTDIQPEHVIHDGSDVVTIDPEAAHAERSGLVQPEQPGDIQVRNEVRTDTQDMQVSAPVSDKVETMNSWAPGANFVPLVDDAKLPTSQAKSAVDLPAPIRRENIIADFAKGIGTSIYEGRVKGKNRLGFFRPRTEEVRIKRANDIEVAAHEVAHLIDSRVPAIANSWRTDKALREELRGVSYDQKNVKEGFAEAVRLYLTQPDVLEAKAPKAYAWLEDFAGKHKYGPALRRAQSDMTAWYGQDALNRARSKIGTDKPLSQHFDGLFDRLRQATVDDLHGIYKMERDLTGKISPVGPYESARLSRAAASISDGAAVLSWDRLARGLAHDPNRGAIAIKAGALAMASAGLYLLNRDDPRYQDLPEWDRDANWHFFVGDKHFRYPKIWEIGALSSAAERTVERTLDENPENLGKDFARILGATFNLNLMPQIVAPIYEQATNRNGFTGAPIETPGMESMQPFLRTKPGTSETMKALGMSTADMPESLQVNPARAEALLRGYFNTWAMYGLMLSDQAFFHDQLPEKRTDELPVVRRFYAEEPAKHTKYEEQFYDLLEEATRLRGTMRELDRIGRQDIADRKDQDELGQEAKPLERAAKNLHDINVEMRLVRRDANLTPEGKRARLDELTIERNALIKSAVQGAEGSTHPRAP